MRKPTNLAAVIINFNTGAMSKRAIDSFRKHYPETFLLLIDNHSSDGSTTMLDQELRRAPSITETICNVRNIHHGPAMDQALKHLHTQFVFFLDSDCLVEQGGFLEQMIHIAESSPDSYAVGHRIAMDKRGFDTEDLFGAIPYVRPYAMLIDRAKYLSLPAFERHGTPCLRNMRAAAAGGYALIDFPIQQFIQHRGRGTVSLHGYNLGLRGKWNYLLHRLGI